MTPDDMEARTPAPEGEVVAWRFRSKDGYGDWSHSNDEPTYLDSRAYDVQPLYASPVVPAGREDKEAAATIERQAAELANCRQHWSSEFKKLSAESKALADEQAAEIERLRDSLLGIALSDRYRRYPKQHEDGGVRGQSGLRAVRALTGQHGSYLNDDDVVRLDKEARAALTGEDAGGAG